MTQQTPPDVIYPVRPGDVNSELSFSLRSLSNLPHGKVWFVGHKPSWVTNVGYIPGGNSAPFARANLYHNLLLACRDSDISESLTVWNDDIYLLTELAAVPVLYRGLLADQLGKTVKRAGPRGWWQESLLTTMTCLQALGHDNPLSYELHTPFPCNKHLMADTLQRFAHVTPHNPPQWRTLYGVIHNIGGVKHVDGKALRPAPLSRPFHSTDDVSIKYFRNTLTKMFPQPSPYEQPPQATRSLVNARRSSQLRATRRTRPVA